MTQIAARAFRFPWMICPNATGELQSLKGERLFPSMTQLGRLRDARTHCTHLFDLAGLMIALATRGIGERRYLACLAYRVDGRTQATLLRDRETILRWDVEGSTVTGEPPFIARGIGTGFASFVEGLLPDEAEAALILRRAVFVSSGRGTPLDEVTVAPAQGGRFVQRPERAHLATRNLGLRRNFTDDPQPEEPPRQDVGAS